MPASKSLPLGPPTRTRTTSKARGRATFDAATADSALRAKSEYSAFIADRRVKRQALPRVPDVLHIPTYRRYRNTRLSVARTIQCITYLC